MRFELPTYRSSDNHLNHYTKESTISGRLRKAFIGIMACLTGSCGIQLILLKTWTYYEIGKIRMFSMLHDSILYVHGTVSNFVQIIIPRFVVVFVSAEKRGKMTLVSMVLRILTSTLYPPWWTLATSWCVLKGRKHRSCVKTYCTLITSK